MAGRYERRDDETRPVPEADARRFSTTVRDAERPLFGCCSSHGLYAAATAATGNVMLAFAAILLGVVVGLQRRASGGILAPILTHCTWSLTMLLALPPVFGLR